ncbi:MAG: hypothetical protein JNN00_10175 [Chitinophagaceae bacterium]|nr:hypothetical protein [Chitinophagaceae bacterium]
MLILSIHKPCRENWPDMTPSERGAYCKHCDKNVVDFSAMPDEKIVQYFWEANQPVCGRFRNDQLNRPLIEIAPSIFAMNIPFWKKFLAALLLFFSSFITGCSPSSQKDYTKAEVPVTDHISLQSEVVSPVKKDRKAGNTLPAEVHILGFVHPYYNNVKPGPVLPELTNY